MRKFKFSIDEDNNVILVDAKLNGFSTRLLLDTGASNTVIDLSTLLSTGFHFKDSIDKIKIETAKGIVEAEVFVVKQLESLGITQQKYAVTAYDFIGNGIVSEFDGVLGLDFFENNKICIDFVNNEITIS
jgi:Aspartyl protease